MHFHRHVWRRLALCALLAASLPALALSIPVKCGDTLVGNIDVNVAANGRGVTGGFTSVVGGPPPTLKAAATACNEDHWNWYQVVTADNQIPGAPYVDPPKGGLGTQWADDLPWYFDEKPVPNPLPPGKLPDDPPNAYQLGPNSQGATLNYFDFPGGNPGLNLSFNVWLVSLNADSSLHSFHEGFSWDFSITLGPVVVATASNLKLIVGGPGQALYQNLIGGFATAVPEPQSWLMWIAGVGLLAGCRLQRQPRA
jgi:hypothetical protein